MTMTHVSFFFCTLVMYDVPDSWFSGTFLLKHTLALVCVSRRQPCSTALPILVPVLQRALTQRDVWTGAARASEKLLILLHVWTSVEVYEVIRDDGWYGCSSMPF